jgi:hypothetical protein
MEFDGVANLAVSGTCHSKPLTDQAFDRKNLGTMVLKEKRERAMQETAARHTADMLLAEHKANTQFKPFDRLQGPANVSDAYDIQQHYVALLRAEHGDSIGYKVGLTSKTMQAFCGIDHPIAGVVLAKREYRSGATIRNRRPHQIERAGNRFAHDGRSDRALYRRRLRRHRIGRRSRGGLQPSRRSGAAGG